MRFLVLKVVNNPKLLAAVQVLVSVYSEGSNEVSTSESPTIPNSVAAARGHTVFHNGYQVLRQVFTTEHTNKQLLYMPLPFALLAEHVLCGLFAQAALKKF